jgi:hypothetical protein
MSTFCFTESCLPAAAVGVKRWMDLPLGDLPRAFHLQAMADSK